MGFVLSQLRLDTGPNTIKQDDFYQGFFINNSFMLGLNDDDAGCLCFNLEGRYVRNSRTPVSYRGTGFLI
jgi:hypothetical protein